jgi:hypothetical protein
MSVTQDSCRSVVPVRKIFDMQISTEQWTATAATQRSLEERQETLYPQISREACQSRPLANANATGN